jgi:ABC-2 type transport system ATP-binding protein
MMVAADQTADPADPADIGDAAVAIRVRGLSKRFRSTWALRDCGFDLPAGRVAALIGANGAGKTTLLTILAGLLRSDSGERTVAGRVAFVTQDKPLYRSFTVSTMLELGARLNRVWHDTAARAWLERFDVPLDQRCAALSNGQRAQVAFALAVGARPDVLLLDEPLANLDPLVRREVTAAILAEAADTGMTVVLSTHIVAELSGVADHLLLLAHGHLLMAGDLDDILATHALCTGPTSPRPPIDGDVVSHTEHGNQSSYLIQLPDTIPPPRLDPPWQVQPVSLEDLVLAQLTNARQQARTEGAGG